MTLLNPLRPYFCRHCGAGNTVHVWTSKWAYCVNCGSKDAPLPWAAPQNSATVPKSELLTVTNSHGFRALMADSLGRNRGPTEAMKPKLDLAGVHILTTQFDHNGVEFRSQWLVKLKNQMEPISVTMDNSYEAFNNYTLRGCDPAQLRRYAQWLQYS